MRRNIRRSLRALTSTVAACLAVTGLAACGGSSIGGARKTRSRIRPRMRW